MNGDVLTNIDYGQFFDKHVKEGNVFTVSAYERDHKVDYGVLETNETNQLVAFKEKPILHYKVSMGVYMLNKACLDVIPDDTFYGFDHLMLDLIKNNNPATVKVFDGYWLDIGRPDDYEQAINDYEAGLIKV